MSEFARRYMAFERTLIDRFADHPFFLHLPSASRKEFAAFLLQLGYLSAEFVKWYERTNQGFASESARELIRNILRDEIPADAPTHQENRLEDLQQLGIPAAIALNPPASFTTRRTVRRMYELVRYPQEHYDLAALVTLRIAGEVLVGETYRHVCPQLARFGLAQEQSQFYWPHFLHDELHEDGEGEGHSNAFDTLLNRFITSEEELRIAMEAAETAFEMRYHFLDQFTARARVVRRVVKALTVAAATLLIVIGTALPARFCPERKPTPRVIATLTDYERFERECDLWLVQRARETGDVSYLATVGTPQAPITVWGQ